MILVLELAEFVENGRDPGVRLGFAVRLASGTDESVVGTDESAVGTDESVGWHASGAEEDGRDSRVGLEPD